MKYKIKDNIGWNKIDDEDIALINPKEDCFYGIEGPLAILWIALVNPLNLEELVSILIKNYDIEKEKAVNDINLFLSQLKEADLIETVKC